MKSFIDIHHHNTNSAINCIGITNVIFGRDPIPEKEIYFSTGIHPWYLPPELGLLKQQEELAYQPNCLAVGECGLDKLHPSDFLKQIDFFKHQLNLAQKVNKPLIIHAVKTHQTIIQIIKKQHFKLPVIFHGFNTNLEILNQIISSGFSISIGTKLLKSPEKLTNILKSTPLDRIFFETDDSKVPIDEIYRSAAQILQMDEINLCEKMHENFIKSFKTI